MIKCCLFNPTQTPIPEFSLFLFYYSNHILDKYILPLSFQDMQQIHDEKIKIHSFILLKLSEGNTGKKFFMSEVRQRFLRYYT